MFVLNNNNKTEQVLISISTKEKPRLSGRKPDKGSHAPKIRTIVLNGFAFFTLDVFFSNDAFEFTGD